MIEHYRYLAMELESGNLEQKREFLLQIIKVERKQTLEEVEKMIDEINNSEDIKDLNVFGKMGITEFINIFKQKLKEKKLNGK